MDDAVAVPSGRHGAIIATAHREGSRRTPAHSAGSGAIDPDELRRVDLPRVGLISDAAAAARARQRTAHGGRYHGVFLDNPDLAAYARLLGAPGIRVTADADLQPAVADALAHPAPASSTSSRTVWRACCRASTRRRLDDLFSSGSPFRRRTGTPERYEGAVKTERQDETADHHRRGAPEHFARFCAAVTARLPFGLSRVVPSTFLGFAAINGFTFCTDLLILTALHSHWGVPYAAAVGIGYAIAFALSFVLNRVLNFRSHGPLGRQTLVYVGVVALNFGILLGVSTGLETLGVQYQVARVAAGACEGLFMYCAMRWVVFRRSDERVARPNITPEADSETVRQHRGRPG